MPLVPPGPKSMAWVADSGKLVALVQWIGLVKICSHSERVIEPSSVRRSDPEDSTRQSHDLNEYLN